MLKQFCELRSHHQLIFALIIGFAVISFWRGMWGLLDFYLFDLVGEHLSYWISIFMGLVILVASGYY
ncbi:hypothetical protein KJ660_01225, partial [Candidatus Micrarchaeota archaeon]|nr:hypothetical protein [Candidatus Micrarchaeota archaeon]